MKKHTEPKPDDRRDNVEKIAYNIGKTIQNMERAEETMEETDDDRQRQAIEEKNDRRRDALRGMREEIRDEAIDRENNYQD